MIPQLEDNSSSSVFYSEFHINQLALLKQSRKDHTKVEKL